DRICYPLPCLYRFLFIIYLIIHDLGLHGIFTLYYFYTTTKEIMGREKQDRQMPELSILENEISVETEKMLSCLKPADRELFWKLYVEEEDLDTVSRAMGMSKSVIYNHLSRGKKKLRNLYGMQPKGDQL
ncbi:MAG TPA: hypothetical protein H9732_00825, partial [Candidatus Mediterraneibacter avicola]|nr:hypothetical protein [Candidatus Mediterraneibacter avicola]